MQPTVILLATLMG